jgi:hypothetical protein
MHPFLARTTLTAIANGRSKVEERLARWLLIVHDRVDDAPHDRSCRPHRHDRLQKLDGKGLIAHRRSYITIVDREGLVEGLQWRLHPPSEA